ncbi:hypothetical protein CQA53_01950 [Helicobacter didelphidarum]|uniref:Alpha/beta hydrolase n=1 Tax=Helicobacter didelphidarum TaxID=2040648 RepID=A0A3D8IQ62_9HELI|nr:hypothetical protein [Helicobacter didelphidarum]RDU67046.1 hypothetical protein CQA53_01950 [Helicobacter didelphidarum]
MKYFNGFGMQNEYVLLKYFLQSFNLHINQYDIIGFDSGAIFALKYALQQIEQGQRVGKVILLSPNLLPFHIESYQQDKASAFLQNITISSPITRNIDTQNNNYIKPLHSTQDLNQQNFEQESYINNNLQKKPYKILQPMLTHAHFNEFFLYYKNNLSYLKIKNKFITICLKNYQNNNNLYMKNFYEYYGLKDYDNQQTQIIQDSTIHNHIPLLQSQQSLCKKQKILFLDNKHQCGISTQSENLSTLRDFLEYRCLNLDKITKKSVFFVAFLTENDRIINSKLVAEYLSQFGVCIMLKKYNHFLMPIP